MRLRAHDGIWLSKCLLKWGGDGKVKAQEELEEANRPSRSEQAQPQSLAATKSSPLWPSPAWCGACAQTTHSCLSGSRSRAIANLRLTSMFKFSTKINP
jgi:hypothetical protein